MSECAETTNISAPAPALNAWVYISLLAPLVVVLTKAPEATTEMVAALAETADSARAKSKL